MTKSSTKSSIQQDILIVLAAEHRAIEQLIDAIETADQAIDTASRFGELYRVMTLHHYGEMIVFYPAMREYPETVVYLEAAEEEHSTTKMLLEQLRQLLPNPTLFQAKLDQFKESIMGHIEEEENEMFFAVRACMSEHELRQMGQDFISLQTKIAPRIEARIKAKIFDRAP